MCALYAYMCSLYLAMDCVLCMYTGIKKLRRVDASVCICTRISRVYIRVFDTRISRVCMYTGIKKLRRVDASAAAAIQKLVNWRGIKNVVISKQFIEKGGTELGPLSTSTALGVAIDYSRSKRSLIFKIITQNKLQRGADLHWLSIFPSEKEVLWPPLTYLQPTGLTQEVEIDGWHFTIVEVQTTQA